MNIYILIRKLIVVLEVKLKEKKLMAVSQIVSQRPDLLPRFLNPKKLIQVFMAVL